MNKLNLIKVLAMETVKENIKGNLGMTSSELKTAIEETLKSGKDNSISVDVEVGDRTAQFENTFYRDLGRSVYLLESRLFEKKNGNMIGTYLEVFNSNGEIVEECIDDVWVYADWKTV